LQQRPNISSSTLTIAVIIKIFLSFSLVILATIILLFATTKSSGKVKTPVTPRPTQTRPVKTPFTFFWKKTSVPTIAHTKTAVAQPAQITQPVNPTAQPVQIQPSVTPLPPEQPSPAPTNPEQPPAAASANIASVQGPIQFPDQPIRADNLAYLKLIGQLGKGKINQVLWAPGSNNPANLVAATNGGFFYLDPSTGAENNSIFLNAGISHAVISPDGTRLVTSGLDNSITIWKYGTGESIATIDTKGVKISSLAYNPDGSTILGAGADGNIYLWNASDGSLIRYLEGNGNPIRTIQISPDGQTVVAGSDDKTLSMWNVASGVRFISITAHYKPVNFISISPDSKIAASASDDNSFILWDTTNGKQIRLTSVESGVRSLAFTKDGTGIISGEQSGTVDLWDIATGKLLKTIGKVPGEVNSIAFNADGSLLAIGANTIHIWRPVDDALAAPFKGFTNSITCLVFNKDATLLAAGNQDGRIALWDPKSGNQIALLEGHIGNVTTLDFSSDGRFLASGGVDNTIIIWDIASGQKVYIIRGHSGGVRSVAFNSDNSRLASAGGWVDITLKMWDMATGTGLYNITGFTKGDIELTLRKGTNMLASAGGDGIIRVWDFNSRELIATIEKHSRAIRSIIFSLDGSQMASTSEDGKTYLWETTGWTMLRNLQTKGSNSLVFSSDNLVLAVAGESIEFWDTSTGNLLTEFAGTPGTLTKLAQTSDGKVLAAGSTDGTIRLYGIKQ
jgi:WD40 repeat protein